MLGVCLGCQVINVHRSGSLIQFLPDLPDKLEHRKLNDVVLRHDVTISPDSVLALAVRKTQISVNTYHKQAVDTVGRGLRVTARAPDGVIEAIEDPTMPLLVGVQWHPERISSEPEHSAIFKMLVEASER
jgi:putative glutamine amidotransferase